jgi:hypothetical protein
VATTRTIVDKAQKMLDEEKDVNTGKSSRTWDMWMYMRGGIERVLG